MKTFSAKPADVTHEWFVIDATAEKNEGRVHDLLVPVALGALLLAAVLLRLYFWRQTQRGVFARSHSFFV